MRAHIIENGIVVNTIEVKSLDFIPDLISAENGGSIGDRYENGVFTTPENAGMTPEQIQLDNKTKANLLLTESDWTQNLDVRDIEKIPHLINIDEFDDYRSALRAIAVNPPSEPAVFPSKPDEVWE